MEISMRSQKLLTSLNRQLHEDLEKARSEAEKSQFLCEVQAERIKEVKEEGILLRKQVESLLCVKNVDEAVRRGKEYYQGLKDSLEHHHGYLIELIAKSKATLAENENFLKALDELETIGM